MDTSTTENYQLKWHSYTSHLHTSVATSLAGNIFTDVTLFTLDGHQIQAHRFILSACSQYLHTVLKTQIKISTALPLAIVLPPEINYKTLKILIQYMYSGEATVSKDVLENVLRGGDLLKIKGLWRPPEEEFQDKRLVRVHQKYNHIAVTPNPKHLPAEKKAEEAKTSTETKSKLKSTSPRGSLRSEDSCDSTSRTSLKLSSVMNNETEKRTQKVKITEPEVEQDESMQYLVIKEEPLEWNEENEEMEFIEQTQVFKPDIEIKPEVVMEEETSENSEELYSPLTCELCSETFKQPAEWVRHIQVHTDMLPAKRQRRGGPTVVSISFFFY